MSKSFSYENEVASRTMAFQEQIMAWTSILEWGSSNGLIDYGHNSIHFSMIHMDSIEKRIKDIPGIDIRDIDYQHKTGREFRFPNLGFAVFCASEKIGWFLTFKDFKKFIWLRNIRSEEEFSKLTERFDLSEEQIAKLKRNYHFYLLSITVKESRCEEFIQNLESDFLNKFGTLNFPTKESRTEAVQYLREYTLGIKKMFHLGIVRLFYPERMRAAIFAYCEDYSLGVAEKWFEQAEEFIIELEEKHGIKV